MRPVDSAGAAEVPEPGLPLTDDAPQGASEEPAAAEAAGTPGPCRCWVCGNSLCGSGASQGECGVQTRRGFRLWGWVEGVRVPMG